MLENIVKKLNEFYEKNKNAKAIQNTAVYAASTLLTSQYIFDPFYHASGFIAFAAGRILQKIPVASAKHMINTEEYKGVASERLFARFVENKERIYYPAMNLPIGILSTLIPSVGYAFLSHSFTRFLKLKEGYNKLEKKLKQRVKSYKLDGSITKSNIFSKFNEEEIKFLEEGLNRFDIQSGCPNSCLGCGAESQKPYEHMSFDNITKILDDLKEVKEKTGIDLLLEKEQGIGLFYASDPVFYHDKDSKGVERNLFDVYNYFTTLFDNQFFTISTAGWRKGNNHMQKAMERITNEVKKNAGKKRDFYKQKTNIMYTIKPFGRLIRKEYGAFLDNLFESVLRTNDDKLKSKYGSRAKQIIDFKTRFKEDFNNHKSDFQEYEIPFDISKWRWFIKQNIDSFIKKSRYVDNIINNLRTLHDAPKIGKVQYLDYSRNTKRNDFLHFIGFGKLPKDIQKFDYLFSYEFMEKVKKNIQSKISKKNWIKYFYSDWNGNSTFNKIETNTAIYKKQIPARLEKNILPRESELSSLYTHINHKGEIEIRYQDTVKGVESFIFPKEYFKRMSEQYSEKDKSKSKFYNMLYNLQGKNLLAKT